VAVVVSEPEVFALVFAAAELSPEVVVLVVEPEVVAVAAEPSPGVVVLAAEPEVVSVVDFEVSEPGVFSVALFSTAHVSEPQASGGIPVVCDVLIPVSVVVLVDLDSSQRPRFLAFPNVDYFASSSSSVEGVGE
jgi:hypothetical protein